MDNIDFTTAAMAEVFNGRVTISNRLNKAIQLGYHPLTLFSSTISNVQIEYVLTISNAVRTGTLNITVDKANESIAVRDDYSYTTNPTLMEGFEITSAFLNNDPDQGTDKETFMLYYTNPTIDVNATGSINFTVKYSV